MQNKSLFFNYAGVAKICPAAYFAMRKCLDDYYQTGPWATLKHYETYIQLLSQALAKLLNCNENELIYTKNTTEGIIMASEILPLNKEKEILVQESEYSANLIPWLKKKKEGFKVNVISGKNNAQRFGNLLDSISSQTQLISISWVQYYDGFQADIPLLADICQKQNIFLVVDGAQIVGTRKIDLAKTKIDILVGCGHKHLQAPVSSGFIYVNSRLFSQLNEYKVGTRSVSQFDKNAYEIRQDAKRLEDGSVNILGIVGLYHCILTLLEIGMEHVEAKNLQLLAHYKEKLLENNFLFVDYPLQGNLLSLKLPQAKAKTEFLRSKQIFTRNIDDILRISFSYLNDYSDIDYFIEKIEEFSE